MTRKFHQREEVKVRARTHQHEETRGMNQQKSKTQIKNDDEELQDDEVQGVPDWLQEFKEGLIDESVPEHRDTSSSSHELPLESRAKWYRVNKTFFTHFPKDRSCHVCLRTKITRASCRKRTATVVPRAEHFGD